MPPKAKAKTTVESTITTLRQNAEEQFAYELNSVKQTTGKSPRIQELTRIPADVQDTLITVLSEKTLPIPEIGTAVQAQKGFNVIATANSLNAPIVG